MPAALRAIVGLAACLLTAGSSSAAVASPAAPAPGTPGYCSSAAGVTVVVDMSALGGGVTVRCAPGPGGPGYTGLDALRGTGFTVAGTQRYGLAFVCRIQGRPSATESIAIPGNPRYHEQCVDTPPQTAFWSYWSARNGGAWTYNTSGASSHDTISGGFEGWRFSLSPSGSPAPPAVKPVRPHASPPTTPPAPPPPTHHHNGGGGGTPPSTSAPPSTAPAPPTSSGPATTSAPSPTVPSTRSSGRPHGHTSHKAKAAKAHPERRQRHRRSHAAPAASAPTTGAPRAGTGNDVRVSGDLPDSAGQSAGSSRPVLLGAGVLAILGLGAGLTAWRRSQRP
jgi:hypothetical protein